MSDNVNQSREKAGEKTEEEARDSVNIFEKKFLAICAPVLIIICIIGFFVCSFVCIKHSYKPQSKELNLAFYANSQEYSNSQELIDFRESVESYINDSERRINDRYEHFIAQKENNINLLVLCSTFIGIVISILAFFGYKSIRDIEEISIKKATDRATAETIESLNKQIPKIIVNKMKNEMNLTFEKKIEDSQNGRLLEYIKSTFLNSYLSDMKNDIKEDIELKIRDELERIKTESASTSETTAKPTSTVNNVVEDKPQTDFKF